MKFKIFTYKKDILRTAYYLLCLVIGSLVYEILFDAFEILPMSTGALLLAATMTLIYITAGFTLINNKNFVSRISSACALLLLSVIALLANNSLLPGYLLLIIGFIISLIYANSYLHRYNQTNADLIKSIIVIAITITLVILLLYTNILSYRLVLRN